jgi:hypothetical protein
MWKIDYVKRTATTDFLKVAIIEKEEDSANSVEFMQKIDNALLSMEFTKDGL